MDYSLYHPKTHSTTSTPGRRWVGRDAEPTLRFVGDDENGEGVDMLVGAESSRRINKNQSVERKKEKRTRKQTRVAHAPAPDLSGSSISAAWRALHTNVRMRPGTRFAPINISSKYHPDESRKRTSSTAAPYHNIILPLGSSGPRCSGLQYDPWP